MTLIHKFLVTTQVQGWIFSLCLHWFTFSWGSHAWSRNARKEKTFDYTMHLRLRHRLCLRKTCFHSNIFLHLYLVLVNLLFLKIKLAYNHRFLWVSKFGSSLNTTTLVELIANECYGMVQCSLVQWICEWHVRSLYRYFVVFIFEEFFSSELRHSSWTIRDIFFREIYFLLNSSSSSQFINQGSQ